MFGMSLVNAFPIVAAAFTKAYDVIVTIGGRDAYTDCKSKINLPSLDWFNEEHVIMAWGYLYHEIFHILFSVLEQAKALIKTALQKEVHNIFEDIYIEKAGFAKHPTVEARMARMCQLLIQHGDEAEPERGEQPVNLLTAYLAYTLRTKVLLQRCYDAYAEKANLLMRELFAPEIMDGIDAIMYRVQDATCTRDCAKLAIELLEYLKLESEKPDNQNNQADQNGQSGQGGGSSSGGEQQGNQKGDSSDQSSGQSGGASQGEQGKQGDGNPSSGGGQQGDQKGNQPGDPNGQPDATAKPGKPGKPGKPDSKGNLVKVLNAQPSDIKPRDPMQAVKAKISNASDDAHQSGLGAGLGEADPLQPVKPSDGTRLVSQVAAQSNALRFALESFIQAETEEDVSYSRQGRRLAANRLHLFNVGHYDVFRHVTQEEEDDTALMLLFDRSSSMKGIIKQARKCVLSLDLALDGLEKVQVASAAFPSSLSKTGVVELSRFEERTSETAGRYNAVNASGGTPMAEAMFWGAQQLLEARNPRKVMFVVSDGCPFNVDATRNIVQAGWNDGIEIYGIILKTSGYQGSIIEYIFGKDRYLVIDSSQQLQDSLFELAKVAFKRAA